MAIISREIGSKPPSLATERRPRNACSSVGDSDIAAARLGTKPTFSRRSRSIFCECGGAVSIVWSVNPDKVFSFRELTGGVHVSHTKDRPYPTSPQLPVE